MPGGYLIREWMILETHFSSSFLTCGQVISSVAPNLGAGHPTTRIGSLLEEDGIGRNMINEERQNVQKDRLARSSSSSEFRTL